MLEFLQNMDIYFVNCVAHICLLWLFSLQQTVANPVEALTSCRQHCTHGFVGSSGSHVTTTK